MLGYLVVRQAQPFELGTAYDEPIDFALLAGAPGCLITRGSAKFKKIIATSPKKVRNISHISIYIYIYPIIPFIHGDNSPVYPIHIPFISPSGKLTDIDPENQQFFEWKRIFQAR